MASIKSRGIKNYCDSMYGELSDMKSRLLTFVRDIEDMRGSEKEMLKSHIPHFQDIVRTIDWKLEILSKVCPFDWAGYREEVEKTVSVRVDEWAQKESVGDGSLGG